MQHAAGVFSIAAMHDMLFRLSGSQGEDTRRAHGADPTVLSRT
ncbi:hypothetical protein ASZ90_015410 [hydrocarbon metagenome]|uniref:Uncharacterized protein n=1 Tax=hydrocarbon metagenome TaxID=938273 RepID=A0A0W8F2G5_9ZZZZ